MTKLICSVTDCIANESQLCSYDSINVGCSCAGSSTGTKDDTLCQSFAEKTATATNSLSSTSSPSAKTQIDCTVADCRYNHSEKCNADSVSVQNGTASSHHTTRCGTFTTR